MSSCQSPEACSTLIFPQQFGPRLANEILLCDKVVTAKEAVASGYANGIIEFDPSSDFVDPDQIPVISKLLKTDYKTLVNCMEQINISKNLDLIRETNIRES